MYYKFYRTTSIVSFIKNVFFLSILIFIKTINAQENEEDFIFQKSFFEVTKANQESNQGSLDFLKEAYRNRLELKDTLNATRILLEKSLIYEHNAEYSKSYDVLWSALLLNDKTRNDSIKSIIYNKLGRIYSYNKRLNKSLEFLNKSLEFQKKKIEKFGLNKNELSPIYFSFTKTLRETNQISLAKKYLDSCYMYFDAEFNYNKNTYFEFKGKAYIDFEKAILLFYEGRKDKAIQIINEILPWFKINNSSYLVLLYKYLADMHNDISDFALKEKLYKNSLYISEKYRAHIDFTPLIYEALSNLYATNGYYKNAFENIKKAKTLDFAFFDSRSPKNQTLLEIKDNYTIEKNRQIKQIQKQNLKNLEQKDRIKSLQRSILIVILVFMAIIGIYLYKYLKNKHKNEKLLIKEKNQLELNKANELLILKNKELTSSALRFIEKEEVLENIKHYVDKAAPTINKSEMKKVVKSAAMTHKLGWEEFNIRFTQVNETFFLKLKEAYPDLTQSDHKICAFIKLNLSSKDISKLLNISIESVHTNRHRLRKKMNLSRGINLEDHICSL